MVEHSVAFQQELFLDCVCKVRNPEVQYRAITFYITQHPLQLGRLLQVLTPNLDHSRVVHLLRKHNAIPLAVEYLKSVQKENLTAVNEALNEFFIIEEDYESLRQSLDDYDNLDQMLLAQKVEKHELLEFRRIAAYIYKKNKRWNQSVQLSKEDRMYKDAIDTCAESGDSEIAEAILRYFVSVRDRACFAAVLYTCYDLIKPDVAMELAWRHGYVDYVMPYIIQYTRHLHDKVAAIDARTAPKKEDVPAANDAHVGMMDGGLMGLGSNLMIANTPYGGYDQGGYGGGYGGQPGYGGGGANMGYGGAPAGGYGGGYGGNMGGGGGYY